MTNIISSFTTREQYLNWRAAWKAQYKDLSVAIRVLKRAISEAQSNGESFWQQQRQLDVLKSKANQMLAERFNSKIRAGLYRNNPDLTEEEYAAQFLIAYERITLARQAKAEAAKIASKVACEARKQARAATPRLQAVA